MHYEDTRSSDAQRKPRCPPILNSPTGRGQYGTNGNASHRSIAEPAGVTPVRIAMVGRTLLTNARYLREWHTDFSHSTSAAGRRADPRTWPSDHRLARRLLPVRVAVGTAFPISTLHTR